MYSEVSKKDFLDVSQISPTTREGIFQNRTLSQWEYWEGGSLVAKTEFSSISSKVALELWLEKIAGQDAE